MQYETVTRKLNNDRDNRGYISSADVEELKIYFGNLYKISNEIKSLEKELGVVDGEPTAFDHKVSEALRSAYGF